MINSGPEPRDLAGTVFAGVASGVVRGTLHYEIGGRVMAVETVGTRVSGKPEKISDAKECATPHSVRGNDNDGGTGGGVRGFPRSPRPAVARVSEAGRITPSRTSTP